MPLMRVPHQEALRQADAPAAGKRLLGKRPAADGLQGGTPHSSSRQDFHSLGRKICFKNSAVTEIKGCFLYSHSSVVSILVLQLLLLFF